MRALIVFLLSAATGLPACADPIGPAKGQQTAHLHDLDLPIFTYRPKCPDPGMLLVFHGLNRNADKYRDHARSLGERSCMIVVAPLFDRDRFPTWRYQRGGIVNRKVVQGPDSWTGRIVVDLVAWLRRQEGRQLPYAMIGHSAGGQFLSRLAAFTPTEAKRIVIANPSTHVFASVRIKAPFGFGGVYPDGAGDAQLRRYLQTPVTIFLGDDDVGDENLSDSNAAQAQGETRYERGMNAFAAAKKLAQSSGWPFNWRLVELPGVGHSAAKMFGSAEALDALSP